MELALKFAFGDEFVPALMAAMVGRGRLNGDMHPCMSECPLTAQEQSAINYVLAIKDHLTAVCATPTVRTRVEEDNKMHTEWLAALCDARQFATLPHSAELLNAAFEKCVTGGVALANESGFSALTAVLGNADAAARVLSHRAVTQIIDEGEISDIGAPPAPSPLPEDSQPAQRKRSKPSHKHRSQRPQPPTSTVPGFKYGPLTTNRLAGGGGGAAAPPPPPQPHPPSARVGRSRRFTQDRDESSPDESDADDIETL